MADGISALTRVQIGVEATAGGSTDPASTYWRGVGFLKDNTELVFPDEKVGKLGGTTRSFIPRNGGEITLLGNATFQQIPYILNSGFYRTTPTTDTSSAQIRTWNVQTSDTDPISSSDLDTLVIEGGDNNQAEVMRYGFVSEFTLSGAMGAGVDISAKVMGRAISKTSFTSGLSIPTVSDLISSLGYFYADSSSDTAGTTLKSSTLFDFSLKVTTGWKAFYAKDGRRDFSFIKNIGSEITLDLTYEHNTNAVTEKDYWLAQTERLIRLSFLGNALSTTDAGATYDTEAFIVDLWGKYTSFDVLSEQDGNNTIKASFRCAYSANNAYKARFINVNELATLP